MKFLRNDDSNPEYVEMRKMLFNPYKLYNCGGVDSVIRGAMNTSAGKSDAFFTPEVRTAYEYIITVKKRNSTLLCFTGVQPLSLKQK